MSATVPVRLGHESIAHLLQPSPAGKPAGKVGLSPILHKIVSNLRGEYANAQESSHISCDRRPLDLLRAPTSPLPRHPSYHAPTTQKKSMIEFWQQKDMRMYEFAEPNPTLFRNPSQFMYAFPSLFVGQVLLPFFSHRSADIRSLGASPNCFLCSHGAERGACSRQPAHGLVASITSREQQC